MISRTRRYAELHAYSNFTFLEGASHPEELVETAQALGLSALALTDRNTLSGGVRFAKAAEQAGLPAICGAEISLGENPLATNRAKIILLAENAAGYANLCELLSRAQLDGGKNNAHLPLSAFAGKTQGLIALCGGANGPVGRALLRGDDDEARHTARQLAEHFPGAFYLELQHHLRPEQTNLLLRLAALARETRLPAVVTNGVLYAGAEHGELADVLTCIRHNTDLAHAGTLLHVNRERYLKSAQQMWRLFEAYPEACAATLTIAERCTYRLRSLRGEFPLYDVPAGYPDAQAYLHELVINGACKRYGAPLSKKVSRQLEHELSMIARMDLAGYFLIVWDIVQAAERLGVLAQGRGSAANSAVCYALGITAVDPVEMNLLFERFLSEERQEYPDIDIDFSHEDREKIIQYVYTRYGRHHAAMAAEIITYRTRSALRDAGRACGLSPSDAQALSDEYQATGSIDAALQAIPQAETAQLIGKIALRLKGFPRHIGIHSGGMIITRSPLMRVAPVEHARMPGRTILQWDKDDLQELGLIKIDLLGLGMLSLLRETFTLYAKRYPGKTLSPATIPQEDPATYRMLQQADSIGVFQVESRAQQSMLPRLKPRTFYDLVVQIAIIRPGPIQGAMIHPFLRRRAGLEPVTYPHPRLKPVLERTMGVPLFQEQGMRLAIEAANFTPGEADILRRAMGNKRSRERMAALRQRLLDGLAANGIDEAAGAKLYQMLEGFADYGFPESHAASFALLAYASAYMKCHEPAIFAAAILNVQPMGFYAPEVLINDAKRHGVAVRPVTINQSGFLSSVESDGALRLGYHLIRGIGPHMRANFERALSQGKFRDVYDVVARSGLSREVLETMAMAGVFSPWHRSRREALWALQGEWERHARGPLGAQMALAEQLSLFDELTPQEETGWDLQTTGVAPHRQPMEHIRERLRAQGICSATELLTKPAGAWARVAGIAITRQRPGTAKGFVFLTLEDETGLTNIILRPDIYEKYRRTVHEHATLIIEGKFQNESGVCHVIAKRILPLEAGLSRNTIQARNFH